MTPALSPPHIAGVFDEDAQKYDELVRVSGLVARYIEVRRAMDGLRAQGIASGDEHDALSGELAEICTAEHRLQCRCGGELLGDEWPHASRANLHDGDDRESGRIA